MDEKQDRRIEKGCIVLAVANILVFLYMFTIGMAGDNEVTTVYVYMDPVNDNDLILQESEVEDVRWFDLHEVIEEIKTSRERFCVPSEGIGIVEQYLNDKL